MPGFANGTVYGVNIDLSGASQFTGTPTLVNDGQMLIASTALNAGGTHVNIGKLTSPSGSISIGYSSPNITLDLAGGGNYYSLTPFIVGSDVHSQYSTIAGGIAAAQAAGGGNVYIKPGTYTENLTLVPSVNLVGYGEAVVILGTITAPASGVSNIQGITIKTNGAFAIVQTSSSSLNLYNCYLNCTNSSGIHQTTGSIYLNKTDGDLGTTGIYLFDNSGSGGLALENCVITNSGSSTTASGTNSTVTMKYCQLYFPLSHSSGGYDLVHCDIQCFALNTTAFSASGGGGNSNAINCGFHSGTASAIFMNSGHSLTMTNCTVESSNTNAISGSGTITYTPIGFQGSSSTLQNTLTLNLQGFGPSNATAGYVLTSNGAFVNPTWQAAGGGGGFSSIVRQLFATSGTYTPTVGMLFCDIQVVGGGGGGGGCASSGGSNAAAAGGGGGGYAQGIFSAASIGASQSVTIGSGGAGGANGSTSVGSTGGTSSVGMLISATGGVGGGGGPNGGGTDISNPPGTGGSGTGGDFQTTGTPGTGGLVGSPSVGTFIIAGSGGSSFFGGGAVQVLNIVGGAGTGVAGTSYGGGGGGGWNNYNGGGAGGGNGSGGVVIITEYI